ncbi:hypothetical protein ACLB2K_033929 [Fragaria x ananassa]
MMEVVGLFPIVFFSHKADFGLVVLLFSSVLVVATLLSMLVKVGLATAAVAVNQWRVFGQVFHDDDNFEEEDRFMPTWFAGAKIGLETVGIGVEVVGIGLEASGISLEAAELDLEAAGV